MATPLGKVVPQTGTDYIDGLVQGSKWDSGNLTYSFWNTESWPIPFYQFYWTDYGVQQFEAALQEYEHIANLSFARVYPEGTVTNNSSDMSIYYQYLVLPIAMGGIPDPEYIDGILDSIMLGREGYPTAEGDVLLPPFAQLVPNHVNEGGGGFQIFIHEIGHALGLKHTHDDGLNGRPTFEELGLPDNQLYTVMSYNQISDVPEKGFPATLMPFDIAAIQYIYGANMTYHAGDDVYTLTDDGLVKTIWDAGGTDTFTAENSQISVVISLREGQFSIHGALRNGSFSSPNADGYLETADSYSMTAIAYDVTIENAIGGSASDHLQGNSANNQLIANSGNDTVFGDTGADTLIGGEGADYLQGNQGMDSIDGGTGDDEIRGGKDSDTITAGAGNDWINGNIGNDTVDAGDGNDVVRGGKDADTLYGAAGDDTIYGDLGNDFMLGGDGSDAFVFGQNSGVDTVGDFVQGEDVIQLATDYYISTEDALAALVYQTDAVSLDLGNGNEIHIMGSYDADSFTTADVMLV
ncbi:MAG: M10 family metallopeptidase C-terminal domain-containing protein [Rickettsiales bacterium]|nr:M10 family metallopeptidase C-terminal domain-containing protein [Rickettsiales bacterium]